MLLHDRPMKNRGHAALDAAIDASKAPVTLTLNGIVGVGKQKPQPDGGPAIVTHGVSAITSAAVAVEISGAGATFPYPLYAKWADTYKKETGIGLNYQSIGSGGGIKQIEAKTVTFGATDWHRFQSAIRLTCLSRPAISNRD